MLERLEVYAVPVIVAGAAIAAFALLWLLVRLVLGVFRARPKEGEKPRPRTRMPWILLILGLGLIGGMIGLTQYANRIDLGERERDLGGKPYLGMTGWDKSDYSFLKQKRNTAILHMRNKDVTDEVVALLAGFDSLEELDLGDTAITDASLPVLASLPALRDLKLDNTAITDAGFREHLLKKASLSKLDLEKMDRKAGVQAKTLREWKNAREGRDYLHSYRKADK